MSQGDAASHKESQQNIDRFNFNARFPEFSGLRSRLKTFDGATDWPGPKVTLMAEAGFFYTGSRDRVQCFYCGLQMAAWHEHENVWFLHTSYLTGCLAEDGCAYVNHMMGKRYVNFVKTRERRPSIVKRRWCFDAERNSRDDWVPCANKSKCALCNWEEVITPPRLNGHEPHAST